MSASVVQEFSATMVAAQGASITTGSLTTTSGHAIMLAIVLNGSSVSTVTDQAGNNYSRLFSRPGSPVLEVWGTTAHSPTGLSSQTITVNFNLSTITGCLTGWELSGALNEDLLDVYVSSATNGTSNNSSNTPTIDNANDLAFGVIGKFPGLSPDTYSSLAFTQGAPSTTWGPVNSTLPNGQYVQMISGALVITSTTAQAFSGTASGSGNALTACWIVKSAADTQQHLFYTGAAQTWIVPAGVTSVTVDMAGGAGTTASGAGGLGGRLQATVTSNPGDTWNIYIGGGGAGQTGGFNGGGTGGNGGNSGGQTPISYSNGGGGGGGTDIRVGGTALTNRTLVAGGGAGSGGTASAGLTTGTPKGGVGGGTTGGEGFDSFNTTQTSQCGQGGTQSAGGAAGNYNPAGQTAGSSGNGGQGSNGGNGFGAGGGGGGGYFGGGGGSGDNGWDVCGGGGGSSFSGSGTSVTHTQGFQSGNGYVTLSWTFGSVSTPKTSTLMTLGVG